MTERFETAPTQWERQLARRAIEGGKLADAERSADHAEMAAEHGLTGDLNVDTYPGDEPLVDTLDCLADAVGRLIATSNDAAVGHHATEMLSIARSRFATLQQSVRVLDSTVRVLKERLIISEGI
jgi:hypothetical protein